MTKSILDEIRNQTETIDCGIGVIIYQEPNNLLLIQLMEKFSDVISEYGAASVLSHLEAL